MPEVLTLGHLRCPPSATFTYDTVIALGPQELRCVTRDTIAVAEEHVSIGSVVESDDGVTSDEVTLDRATLRLRERFARQVGAVIKVSYDGAGFESVRRLGRETPVRVRTECALVLDGSAEGYLLAHAELESGVSYRTERHDALDGRVAAYEVRVLAERRLEGHPAQPVVTPIELRTVAPSAALVCYYVERAADNRIVHVDSVLPAGGATMRSTLRLG